MTTTASSDPSSTLRPLTAKELRWSSGFWHDVVDRTYRTTVPNMWADLRDESVSPAWRNFLIAVGERDGEHEGPPFLDGDLYKWLEAAISQLEVAPEPWLREAIGTCIALIASAQRKDGYIHTATLIARRRDPDAVELADRFHFETYNHGHLISAAVRHHQVTGETTFLDIARRAAQFLLHLATDKPVELARSAICPSHYMAVVDLYRATGDGQYRELAEAFVRVRDEFRGGDDNQDRIPVREQRVAAGHAVRANYLYAGLADLIAETGDAELQQVLETVWADVVDRKMYLTGGCGALYDGASPDGFPWQGEISRVHQAYGRSYQLPNTTAHNETCANIGMILWSERMLALTGEARYADVIERVAYNSLLSGVSLDGSEFCYTNPLRQVRELPFPLRMPGDTALRPIPDPPPSHARMRQRYMACFCCPPNVARTLARFHERAASAGPDGLWIHLYGGSTSSVALEGSRSLGIKEVSDYPWDGRIQLTVTEAGEAPVSLRLRIPGWAVGAAATVAGESVEVEPGTYLHLERVWSPGDEILLDLPMPVRMLRGNRLAEEITNQVAFVRGPLVYALESHDLPDGVMLEQVGVRRNGRFAAGEGEIDGHRVVELQGEGVLLPPPGPGLYNDITDQALEPVPLRLVPYFAWGNRGPGEMSVWLPVAW